MGFKVLLFNPRKKPLVGDGLGVSPFDPDGAATSENIVSACYLSSLAQTLTRNVFEQVIRTAQSDTLSLHLIIFIHLDLMVNRSGCREQVLKDL
jgi:hypothetical protein